MQKLKKLFQWFFPWKMLKRWKKNVFICFFYKFIIFSLIFDFYKPQVTKKNLFDRCGPREFDFMHFYEGAIYQALLVGVV